MIEDFPLRRVALLGCSKGNGKGVGMPSGLDSQYDAELANVTGPGGPV
jgi:hypothetical protein